MECDCHISAVIYVLNTGKNLGFSGKGKEEHAVIHYMINLNLAQSPGGLHSLNAERYGRS